MEIYNQHSQHIIVILLATIVSAGLWIYFSRRGLLALPKEALLPETVPAPMMGGVVMASYALYFLFQMLVVPFIALMYICPSDTHLIDFVHCHISADQRIIVTMGGVVAATLILVALTAISPQIRQTVWGIAPPLPMFWHGAFFWVLSFPIMLIVGQVIALLNKLLQWGPPQEQTAVQVLRELTGEPLLFGVTALAVIFIVPLAEELLFRGLLQRWLRMFFPRGIVLVGTALLFALFHFSSEQKTSNVEIIFSLFVLALFLGFLYEKYQSIWAPLGLHCCFNTISVLMIALS